MRRAVAVSAVVGLALGTLYLLGALRYDRGTLAHPGPGVFPRVVAGLLLLAAIGTGLEAVLDHGTRPVAWPGARAGGRVIGLAAATTAYAVLLPVLGHPVGGGLLALVALRLMGLRPWWWALALAVALTGASHYLFTVWLGVPLPAGRWLG